MWDSMEKYFRFMSIVPLIIAKHYNIETSFTSIPPHYHRQGDKASCILLINWIGRFR